MAKFETGISDFLTLLCISLITLSYSSAASFQMVELELFHCSACGRKFVSEAKKVILCIAKGQSVDLPSLCCN